MPIEAGQQLLHYRLIEKLGEGGMGVVWKAVDTTLDRQVAVKILPDAFERHPDRLDRFEREAKVLASLHHPNIAVLHGLHSDRGVRFLVMELVEGEDLSKRLARGPLPTVDAMKLCAQVARALQAAHDRNVVHRDLKPANIVLTASGEAKVLDFGLAKVLEPDGNPDSDETSAPTVTTGGTVAGTILGTAAYMSPEQARGKATDRRTDIWSFGCVLHECLTGKGEFRGDTMSDSIGAILHKEPDWAALPGDLPVTVSWLLRRCLTKDRDNRLHDIADARIELEQAIVDPNAGGVVAPTGETTQASARPGKLGVAVAALLIVLAALGAWWLKPAPPSDEQAVGLSVQLPTPQDYIDVTLSPDGSVLVYRAVDEKAEGDEEPNWRLWQRRMDTFLHTPIPGTEKANRPTFSPDGRMLAYIVDRKGGGTHQAELRVVGLDGRPPLTVATNATDHAPPVWLSDEEIVYPDHENEKRLLAISRGGGEPRIYAELPKETSFSTFEFDVVGERGWITNNGYIEGRPSLELYDPVSGEEHPLLTDARNARFLDDGRLLFVRGSALLLGRVDLEASPPALLGELTTVMGTGADPDSRIRELEVSEAGHLAFVTGQGPNENRRLMTVDRQGVVEPLIETRGSYAAPIDLSADGRLLSVAANDDESPATVWVVELDTGAKRPMAPEERVTFGGCWLPDGRIVFTSWQSIENGRILVREMRRNSEPAPLFANWPEELKLAGPRTTFDGSHLAFEASEVDKSDTDIWTGAADGSGELSPLIATGAIERQPSFSPDGSRLAYLSNESGRFEVYVRPHRPGGEPTDGGVVKVSRAGGDFPHWSADGTELFFSNPADGRILSVHLLGESPLAFSLPEAVIADVEPLRASGLFGDQVYLPMPDGERFVFVQNPDVETKVERIEVVRNWERLLER